ncbi:MAG: ABC transporter ATP-binding protein [Marinilabiliaceae bacterium]|nr:ABC transporter ATP-binding protein [Marinilabiliaceae bacterium]
MIHARNIVKTFRSEGFENVVLRNVNVDIESGEFVAVLGPSGSGKTSLLNILGLVDVPTSGEFFYLGHEITKLKERQRINLRRGSVGFVFQHFGLIDELTAGENIELPLQYLKYTKKERVKKVNEVLEKMNIAHRKKYFPRQLSGLQQQLVSIGRALAIDPDLILADEPTGSLNSSDGGKILELLSSLNEQGNTILMATHSAADAEKAQRVIQIFDGHIVTENIKNRL